MSEDKIIHVYDGETFVLEREAKEIRMYWNGNEDHCIIIDNDDNVLFEISVDCVQNSAFLRDLTKE